MKLRVYLIVGLTLLGCPLTALAQQSGLSTSTVAGTPWVQNRAIGEGAGIRTGSVEWHPGISGEFGYDSNYLQRASSAIEEANFGPVVPSLRIRVTPQLSLRTLDRSAEQGQDVAKVPKPVVMFNLMGAASYNEFIALKNGYASEFADLRNIQGGGGGSLRILPDRVWSGELGANYTYTAEPGNVGGFGNQFDRHTISAGAAVNWAPGGGAFRWTLLQYSTRFTLFDENDFGVYNNGNHLFTTSGSWKFLPKTAVLYDGQFGIIQYDDTNANDGQTLQARMGLSGLLTKRLGLLAMGGWANSFYQNDNGVTRNYSGFVGKAEAKWYFSADGKLKEGDADVGASALAAGYVKDYNNSYLGNYFSRQRGYAQMSYLIGGRVVTTLEGGISFIEYPDYLSVGQGEQPGFGEKRIDIQGFVEYRPIQTVGINLQLRYDQNISRVIDFNDYTDDLSFNRFQAIVGARWFL